MQIWILVLLILVNCVTLWVTYEPENLTQLRERYQTLVDYINNNLELVPKKFHIIGDRAVIVGRKGLGMDLGYNINKGFEIGLCLDGTANDMFHVLLHELSHSTVEEYSHSEEFWKNFSELRDLSVQIGVYERISGRRAFCGKYISD